MDRTWRRFFVGGLCASLLLCVVPPDLQPLFTLAISAVALVALRRGTRQWGGAYPRPWNLLRWGGWTFIAAAVVRGAEAALTGVPKPFPSPADPLYYVGYALVIAGVVALVRRRSAQVEGDNLLDALILVTCIGVFVTAYVIKPYLDADLDLVKKTLTIAYTLCDLVLVAVTVRLAVGGGQRNVSYYLLGGAFGLSLIADVLASVETAGVSLAPWTFVSSALVYVLAATAALHPSMALLSLRPPPHEVRLTRRRLVLLFTAMVLVPGMLAVDAVFGRTPRTSVYAAGSVVMALLVLGRLAGLVRSKERKATREAVLRSAAASFAGTADADAMLRFAVDALATLVDVHDGGRVSLATNDDGVLTVVASVGEDAERAIGAAVDVAALPELPETLAGGETYVARDAAPVDVPGGTGESYVLVVPLVARQSIRGAFVVTLDKPVVFEVARAVGSLADQLSVALEAHALADEIARRRHERRFRALVEHGSDLVMLVDDAGNVSFASPASEHLLGLADTDIVGRHPFDRIHPDDRFLAASLLDVVWASAGAREPIEARFEHVDGSWRWFEVVVENLLDEPEVAGLVVHFRDITDRKRAQLELEESASRFRSLVQHASDVVVVLDEHAHITYVSPSVTRVLGYLPDEIHGTSGMLLVHDDDLATLPHEWHDSFPPFTREVRVRRRNGDWAVVEFTASDLRREPGVAGVVLNGRDVTDRKTLEAELRRLALHDGLTDLANRTLFLDRVTQALVREHTAAQVAVLFVDLDDFKTVNDGLGHIAGDALLRAVAGRLEGCVRAQDTAARLGGDEFGVLLDGITEAEAVEIAHRISAALGEPFVVDGRQLHVTATVGVVVRHGEEVSTEVLLRRADVAMYLAKTRGKNRVQVYESGMEELFRERLELKGDLAVGLAQQQFRLMYQPIVSLADGSLEGFEALVRWQHPERGLVPPNVFVPIAEETGDIVPLGQWVLATACEQLAAWQRTYNCRPRMSVNLSIRQLEHPALLPQVRAAIADAGIDAADLTLEITESVLAADVDVVRGQLEALKELGVKVAIDDFGTGYSSFGYLNQFPIDVLKIDRAFVMDLDAAESEQADIVRAIVALARSRGLRTVAEGIEERAQADVLRELGCDTGQGYLYAKPLPPDDLAETLAAAARPVDVPAQRGSRRRAAVA